MKWPVYSEVRRQAEEERRNRIVNSFSVQRIDGVDYILHNGVVVSRPTDADVLDRLNELRTMALRRAHDSSSLTTK